MQGKPKMDSSVMNKEQKDWYENYFLQLLSQFSTAQNQELLTINARKVICLSDYFSINISDDILVQMLQLPLRQILGSGFHNSEKEFENMEERFSEKERFHQTILDNIANYAILSTLVANAYLEYCLLKKLPQAVSFATSHFNQYKQGESYDIAWAVDYLIHFKGKEYADGLIDDRISDSVLDFLVARIAPDGKNLLNQLEKRYDATTEKCNYVLNLLKMNSVLGFESFIIEISTYLEEVGDYRFISREIAQISDFQYLPYLERMFPLVCRQDFPRHGYDSLGNGVYNALSNLIIKDYKKMQNALDRLLIETQSDAHLVGILSRL